ncbi:MAG: CotH kinase family protein [Verrucomicrobiota bacterium]
MKLLFHQPQDEMLKKLSWLNRAQAWRPAAKRNQKSRVAFRSCSIALRRLCSVMFLFANALVEPGLFAAAPDVVINEIMYNPPDERDDLQFVELHNRSAREVRLAGWSFSKGLKFQFPASSRIPPGGYVAVCRDTRAFTAHYATNAGPVLGNFEGKLSHQSERIELVNEQNQVIDSVKYSDKAPWPIGADGYSASLERICPDVAGDLPENWAPSPLPKYRRAAGTPGRPNSCHSRRLPPVISEVRAGASVAGRPIEITATVSHERPISEALLLFEVVSPGRVTAEKKIPLQQISDDGKRAVYRATIDPQPENVIVRYRFKVVDDAGSEHFHPSPNEPRPTFSCSTFQNNNDAKIAFGFVINPVPAPERHLRNYRDVGPSPVAPSRGTAAFVYVPPNGGAVQVFDHVRLRPRRGGHKIHFHKDAPLKNMTTVNVIFEYMPRFVLAEPLAYEVYRKANVPAPAAEHIRLWMDGRPMGYHLMVEQPNKSFLARHERNDSGNLYKIIWFGHGTVEKHEKKTNRSTGHQDIVQLIEGLTRRSGADQWAFIQQHFNVDEVINYFAVNMCIQNWDGFFNNYFIYHDTGGTGKWEIYPWDEDKTWGEYDGASSRYDWYELPLNYGANGNNPGRAGFNRGLFGGPGWWRPPGPVSGPLLANAEFRKRFLVRLGEICQTIFTEEKMFPVINALENRLATEIEVRAQLTRQNPEQALETFRWHIESFRNQTKHRRQFILDEIKKELK